tara:strand:- start:7553 stop:8764 length:1212 start_codon:yes stop_codon:yes gene_type:complete
MGSIFKRIKKTVSKIKNPLGKLFRKVGKGIAKLGGKVWKGIKDLGVKAFDAYGKFSKKLGPIGMIGMSIAMPYLLGAFGTTGAGLWTGFGSISKTASLSTNPFMKVLGYAGKGVYKTSNFIGGTYRGITQTIGKTFEGFAGVKNAATGVRGKGSISQGFTNLFKGTSEVISGKAGMGTSKFLEIGGVNLGNFNVDRKLSYDVFDKTYGLNGTYSSMSPDVSKYHRTIMKNTDLDAQKAWEYAQNNGVYSQQAGHKTNYILDKSMSPDFSFTAPVEPVGAKAFQADYDWTGTNIKNTMKGVEAQGAGMEWSPKGPVYETKPKGLLDSSNAKKVGKTILRTMAGDDNQAQQYIHPGSEYELHSVAGAYDPTKAFKSAGSMTTEAYKKWMEDLQLNISGSRPSKGL